MKEALKLALEALVEMSPSGPIGSEIWHKQMNAIRVAGDALAQPDAFEQGRQEGMKQERALWTLSKLGQEIEAQQGQDDRRLQIAMRQWEDWKTYALELQKKLVKYEGGSPMILNTQPDHIRDATKMMAQPEERNFCPRCGKRTADLTTVHTCTPPQDAR